MNSKFFSIVFIALLLSSNLSTEVFAESNEQNYIRTRTMTKDDASTYLETIQYYDGLGRPVQTVQKGITPAKADVVTYQEYDGFSRESITWLPRVKSGNGGNYVQLTDFKNLSTTIYQSDSKPCSQTVYEDSPLNRVVRQYGPGAAWNPSNGINGKPVSSAYLTNNTTTDELKCRRYDVNGSGASTTLSANSTYPANQLFVNKVMDEDGNSSYEFRNKLKQVVLTRQKNGSEYTDTYYAYDDFGNLSYVLPPMIDLTSTPSNDDITALKEYAYLYKYDARNRCVKKRLPGSEWTFYVYDKADRVIYTQDGEQSKKSPKEWTFSIPDAFGRIVLTGICKDTISVSNKVVKAVFSTTGTYKGYTIQVDGVTKTFSNTPSILSVNYYDNYSFLGYHGIPNDANTQYNAENGYSVCYGDHQTANASKSKGLLTGTLTAQLESSGSVASTYLYSVMYYDHRNRVVQVKSNNQLSGGTEKEYIAYNFTGQPTASKHVHFATGKGTYTQDFVHTYDHALRRLKTTYEQGIHTLAENTYDELGRLSANKKGGLSTLNTSYAYNVRSWVKTISSPLFTETLYYNDTYGGSTGVYNGNVSAMSWRLTS